MTAESHLIEVTLAHLLPAGLPASAGALPVAGLTLDSRKVSAGDVFVALAGVRADGRQYINDAINRGAVAVLVDADANPEEIQWLDKVPVIAVNQLAQSVSAIAARFYQQPTQAMKVIGVTGTNGKTTCSLLLAQLFAVINGRAGVMGTLGCGALDSKSAASLAQQISALPTTGLTTPDPITVQRLAAELHGQGIASLAMEVSSHSLVQGRVAAVQFDCAIFTNLTQDHLDYHGSLAAYGEAKQQLLKAQGLRYAIVNADDAWAKSLLTRMPLTVASLSYSVSDICADIYARELQLTFDGIRAEIVTPWGVGELRSSLLGEFNLSNLLAVIAAAGVQDVPLARILEAIPQLCAAPGRMQSVYLEQPEIDQDIHVVVDYAHTPAALETTLNAIRAHQPGRIWTVFGCGGDRDTGKRPLMGRIAERLSDYVIVTNDNPRGEDPAVIAADILRGMHNTHGCLVIADRAQAIDLAVQQARPGDLILVAGKGHEDYQIFATQTIEFSDVKQVRLSLQRRLEKQLKAKEVQP